MTCSALEVDGVRTILCHRGAMSERDLEAVREIVRSVVAREKAVRPVDDWTDFGGEA